MQLRPYQIDIIEQTINSDESTLIQVPTGGGKTVIAKEIVKFLINQQNKQVLFVAPQINLMEQTKEEFQELFPQIIHGKEDNKNHSVLISTLQTASRRDINPDVIIIDEVHHGFEGKMIAKLRSDNPKARIIGLSATPYDKSGKQLQGFSLVLDRYDMKYMIENNFLVNLQVKKLVHIRNLDTIKPPKGSDYNTDALGKIMCNDKTIMDIVRTTGDYIWDKKTIVFAVNISHAELLTKAYQDEGFTARVIHSELPNKNLAVEQEIQDFKDGKTKILVSVAMLTTGFNVPDTDVAVIARPTKSQNLYKQMVGRVLRRADGKTHALLLDCGNVIDELGYPLEPIKERITKEIDNGKQKCGLCGSENLKLIHKDEKSYWECKECKHLKPIEQGSYECMWCKKRYTYDSKFIIKNNALYLDCEDCQDNPMYQPTKISEFIGQVGFVSVEDSSKKSESEKSLVKILDEKKYNENIKKNDLIDLNLKRKKEIAALQKEMDNLQVEFKRLNNMAAYYKSIRNFRDHEKYTSKAKIYDKQIEKIIKEINDLERIFNNNTNNFSYRNQNMSSKNELGIFQEKQKCIIFLKENMFGNDWHKEFFEQCVSNFKLVKRDTAGHYSITGLGNFETELRVSVNNIMDIPVNNKKSALKLIHAARNYVSMRLVTNYSQLQLSTLIAYIDLMMALNKSNQPMIAFREDHEDDFIYLDRMAAFDFIKEQVKNLYKSVTTTEYDGKLQLLISKLSKQYELVIE